MARRRPPGAPSSLSCPRMGPRRTAWAANYGSKPRLMSALPPTPFGDSPKQGPKTLCTFDRTDSCTFDRTLCSFDRTPTRFLEKLLILSHAIPTRADESFTTRLERFCQLNVPEVNPYGDAISLG